MNQRSKILIGAAAVFTVVLVALPSREPETPPAQPDDAQLPADSEVRESSASVATEVQLAAQAARSAAIGWSRNPFALPAHLVQPDEVVASAEEPEVIDPPVEGPDPIVPLVKPRLTGVSRQGAEYWAIIDGEVVTEGDSLSSGHHIASINGRTVTVLLGEERLTIDLGEEP